MSEILELHVKLSPKVLQFPKSVQLALLLVSVINDPGDFPNNRIEVDLHHITEFEFLPHKVWFPEENTQFLPL